MILPPCLLLIAIIQSSNSYVVSPKQRLPNTVEILSVEESVRKSAVSLADIVLKSPLSIEPQETTPVATVNTTLSPLEAWCLSRLDRWYSTSQSLKCPFFRRRSGDLLDTLELAVKHVIIRKECWPLMGPPQAHRPAGTNKKTNSIKYNGLSLSQLYVLVLDDWKPETDGKGYYITGKLTTQIYRDDCLFLGPDPDMPIHGLRKYVGVASHLFDYDTSRATLHSLDTVLDDFDTCQALVAKWTMSGILRLPWKPSLPTFSGQTTYHIDEGGLIFCHEEKWDCSVIRAFCHTLLPDFVVRNIWSREQSGEKE
jgi:hypothetical protein